MGNDITDFSLQTGVPRFGLLVSSSQLWLASWTYRLPSKELHSMGLLWLNKFNTAILNMTRWLVDIVFWTSYFSSEIWKSTSMVYMVTASSFLYDRVYSTFRFVKVHLFFSTAGNQSNQIVIYLFPLHLVFQTKAMRCPHWSCIANITIGTAIFSQLLNKFLQIDN